MHRFGNCLLNLSVSAALAAGCGTTKSANPLSPSLAGPIAGVGISAPKPLAPTVAAEISVEQQPVTLTVENSSTNGVRPLSYVFELSTDATFAATVFSQTGVKPGSTGRTTLQVPQPLTPERTYYWRSKADDGANASEYSPAINFRVYTPVIIQAPAQRDPADGMTVASQRPTLVVANAQRSGPAGEMQYLFEVATDAAFSNKAFSTLVNEGAGQTSFTPSADLAQATRYYWRALATDPGHQSSYSTIRSFVTPAAPIIAPPPGPGPTPNPSAADQLNMSQADIINNPRDLADWVKTTKITSVDFSTGYMMVDFDQRLTGRWPESDFGVEYTLGMCFFLSNQWRCSAVIQFWTGRDLEASGPANEIWKNWYYGRWGIMDGHQPAIGEMVGIFVAQGNLRDIGKSTLRERSNVIVIPFGTNYVAR